MRRLIPIIVLVTLAALGITVYLLFFSGPPNESSQQQTIPENPFNTDGTPTNQNGNPPGQFPNTDGASQQEIPVQTIQATLGLVAQNQARAYSVLPDNSVILIEPTGAVVQVIGNTPTTLSSSSISSLSKATFSADGKKILASYGDQRSLQWSVFDTKEKSWQPLAVGIQSAGWAPSGYSIAYLIPRGGALTLETLDLGSARAKPRELLRIPIEDARVEWVTTNTIAIADIASAKHQGSLWLIDVVKKTITPVARDQYGLTSLWNARGSRALVFTSTGSKGGTLRVVSSTGAVVREFNPFFLTLPEKCAFASREVSVPPPTTTTSTKNIPKATTSTQDLLFCAIPRNLQTFGRAELPDAYNMHSLYTIDSIYRVNIDSGADVAALFADQKTELDATALRFTGSKLYFINRYDEKVYALSLP